MSIPAEFEKGPTIEVVYKLGPGVAEGQPVHIGGSFNLALIPGEPKELPVKDAHALVKACAYVDYVKEADRPKGKLKEDPAPPVPKKNRRRCPEC